MKLVTTLLFVMFSFLAVNAQEIELTNEINTTLPTIESISVPVLNEVEFTLDNNTITKKKSYKYIIENTLSGRKNLIFKTKKSIKIC